MATAAGCMFSCRILHIDFYTAAPIKDLDVCYSEFRSSAVEKVPVIRIFGATPVGQKACLHVHGVFPYIYIPCRTPDPDDKCLLQLGRSIDHAIQVSFGAASKPANHVFKIVVVKGIPFYGYHPSEELFFKIYLYNPMLVKRLSELLLAGAVLNQALQPHEAHIPFVLQFMIDYNLFGMNFIHLSAVKFRLGGERSSSPGSQSQLHSVSTPLSPSRLFCSPSQTHWNVDTMPKDMLLCVPRASVCELEADALAADIVNRHEASLTSGGYPGLAAIWEEERQRRCLLDVSVPLTPPPSPERDCPVMLPNEQRLRAKFDEIVNERLGTSPSPEAEEKEAPPSLSYSQSCDLEVHQPIRLEDADLTVVTRQPEEEEAIVDEEAVHQSMEMSQKFSVESIRKATDAELLDLLLDLAQTPPTETSQLSQSMYTSQSVVQLLSSKLRRSQSHSHSVTSSSLFGSPSSNSIPGSNQSYPRGSQAMQADAVLEGSSETELSGGLCLELPSPVNPLTSDDELFDHSPKPQTVASSLYTGVQSGTTTEREEADEFDMMESQFDIPCAQIPSSQEDDDAMVEQEIADHISIPESSNNGETEAVQLEYEMPEISISQLEASQNPLITALEDSPGHSGFGISQLVLDISQLPLTQMSTSQKMKLLRLCSEEGEEMALGEVGSASEDEGESEEESFWMSQPNYDMDPFQQQSTAESVKPKEEDDATLSEIIPQLDGSGDIPAKGGKSKKTRKTLGLKRKHSQSSNAPDSPQKKEVPQESTTDSGSEQPKSSDEQPEGRAHPPHEGEEKYKNPPDITSPKKARLSLSLRKSSKARAESQPKSPAKLARQPSSINDHPLAKQWKQQALTHSLRPKLERLSEARVSEYLRKKPRLSKSDSNTAAEMRKIKSRKRSDSSNPMPRSPVRTRSMSSRASSVENEEPGDSFGPEWLEKYTDEQLLQIAITESLKPSTFQSEDEQGIVSPELLPPVSVEVELLPSEEPSSSVECAKDIAANRDQGVCDSTNREKHLLADEREKSASPHFTSMPLFLPGPSIAFFSCESEVSQRDVYEKLEASTRIPVPESVPDPEETELLLGLGSRPLDSDSRPDTTRWTGEDASTVYEISSQGSVSTESDFHLALTSTSDGESESDAMSIENQDNSAGEGGSVKCNESLGHIPLVEVTFRRQSVDSKATSVGLPSLHSQHERSQTAPEKEEKLLTWPYPPPTVKEMEESAHMYGLPQAVHTKPFYSNPSDVQPPRSVGGRLIRVPSRMSYDLPDFKPAYSRSVGPNALLSVTGLEHWRTCIGMLHCAATQPLLPPPCHPTKDSKSLHTPYTAEDHKSDVELLSAFFNDKEVVRTPVAPSPHPGKVAAWVEERIKAFGTVENKGGGKEKITEHTKPKAEDTSVAEGDTTHRGEMSVSDPSSLSPREEGGISGAQKEEEVAAEDPIVDQKSSQVSDKETAPGVEDRLKSPGSILSDSSVDSSGLCLEQSLTSYQVPKEESTEEASELHKEREKFTLPLSPPGNEDTHPSCDGVFQASQKSKMEGDSSMATVNPPLFHSTPFVNLSGRERKEEATPVRMKETVTSGKRPQLPFTPLTQLKKQTSQLEATTPDNTYGFKIDQSALLGACDTQEVQYLTSLSVELHVRTRSSLHPDPEFDPVLAVFFYLHNDWPTPSGDENSQLGVIAIDVENCKFTPGASPLKDKNKKGKQKSPAKQARARSPLSQHSPAKRGSSSPSSLKATLSKQPDVTQATPAPSPGMELNGYLARCGISSDIQVTYATSETDLIEKLVQLVKRCDPDFLIGYEVKALSWGYLVDRAATLGINLANELSRMPNLSGVRQYDWGSGNGPGARRPSDLHILGRIVLNVWKILRHEVALNVYSFENVAYHVLHQRIPLYSFRTLTTWYEHKSRLYSHRVVEHYVQRCHGNHNLLEKFNLIGRTSEFARLYGIEFENVITRGSQYRVESMLLRLAKPANFIAVSPSVQQRARMAAAECGPLILEPESKFYPDPVLVLDFQSLYPSIVIAYNYCFSTCLGRVRNLALHGDFAFGTTSLNVPIPVLREVKDGVSISPNGVVFVKPHIRKGIMPSMLEEILGTRIMVKNSMKQHKGKKALGRMLDARQLGLKMIANVTYGYTAASFSGRMPCIEVGDSIVRKARETLEQAIQLVNSTPEWRARVVYGATDSMFVLLRGASKDEAFRIGREICERVTAANPKPVKLKFEKVYLPCVLQTKMRYVGFMYESPEQTEPQFDAKGIETVRRDTCPAVAKVLEKSLRLLFSTRNLSLVKSYFQRQCQKILDGHVSIQDYTFAKEYRGRYNYRPGACVPALELTKQSLAVDRCSEPRVGERVPYVIVYGSPGQPLIQLVRRPRKLLENPALRLNGVYYITKQILPALDRAFSLLGVDVNQWYAEVPRVLRAPVPVAQETSKKKLKGTLGQYFATMHCPTCGQLTVEGVCSQCRRDPQKVAIVMATRIQAAEQTYLEVAKLCQNCVGSMDPSYFTECISLDCPVLYRLHRAKQDVAISESLHCLLDNTLHNTCTW